MDALDFLEENDEYLLTDIAPYQMYLYKRRSGRVERMMRRRRIAKRRKKERARKVRERRQRKERMQLRRARLEVKKNLKQEEEQQHLTKQTKQRLLKQRVKQDLYGTSHKHLTPQQTQIMKALAGFRQLRMLQKLNRKTTADQIKIRELSRERAAFMATMKLQAQKVQNKMNRQNEKRKRQQRLIMNTNNELVAQKLYVQHKLNASLKRKIAMKDWQRRNLQRQKAENKRREVESAMRKQRMEAQRKKEELIRKNTERLKKWLKQKEDQQKEKQRKEMENYYKLRKSMGVIPGLERRMSEQQKLKIKQMKNTMLREQRESKERNERQNDVDEHKNEFDRLKSLENERKKVVKELDSSAQDSIKEVKEQFNQLKKEREVNAKKQIEAIKMLSDKKRVLFEKSINDMMNKALNKERLNIDPKELLKSGGRDLELIKVMRLKNNVVNQLDGFNI
ncbi:meiosis-specific nuclear structural protein, putative [Entamoeba invadens IP1]|uniref:meiosis-specific nuclear structural protein, putative n=1 Tax=Entamoeba invadens IP1 TaxID=370355 RepID=UPI0002C3E9A9|nr:meiosis-specific nuclear structural protein, putative [Entamoeba invadens IP1]ELP93183.1 meiosis-specific nuclear structural protein, putative [Entamoeba invadens IP1]|eukprot:XP_004259954.1 meiosis-specific nuclear structural protein, putative [Entamoeba invadens IP1]